MQRETAASPQFKHCFQMIDSINQYCQRVCPELYESLTRLSYFWAIQLLYSGDKTQAVGSVLFLSNMMTSGRFPDLFNDYILETFNGLFSLLNRISCKFSLTTQKKVHELCKAMIYNLKESIAPEDKVIAFKRITDFMVRLLPQNKQQEQKILMNLMNCLFSDSLNPAQLTEIMCGETRRQEDRINIGDLLNHEYAASDSVIEDRYPENCPPLYVILKYVTSTLMNYKTLIHSKNATPGSFRFLTYDDCSTLTSVVLVLNYLFKWKINFELFDRSEKPNFDPHIQEILETLLDIIKENEFFNEKKMGGRGSSIKKEERVENPGISNSRSDIESDMGNRAARPPGQMNFKPNLDVHYQNFEYYIFVDDYDFQVQGWSILIENIIMFLSSFLVKPEVFIVIKKCRPQEQPQNPAFTNQEAENENPILKLRYTIIAKMFDLFSRLEHRIRQAVDKGFKQLLKVEVHEREIIPRDQLEQCFKPLLAFMQNQDINERKNSLNENSMHCFKKLFQLFKGCFNAQRLFDKFTEYLTAFEQMLSRNDHAPPKEEDMAQMNSIFRMIAIISKNQEFPKMLPRGFDIEKKLGERNVYFYSIKSKLEKLLNGQSSVVISNFTKEKLKKDDYYFMFLIDTLNQPESHPLRERICREDPMDFIKDISRELEERKCSKEEYQEKLFRWSKIVYILTKRLPWFLSRNTGLMKFYSDLFKELISELDTFNEKYNLPTADSKHKCEIFILVIKILVALVSNCEEVISEAKIEIIFGLIDVMELKINYYTNFIRKFFSDVIPKKFSQVQKRQIFMHYLDFYKAKPTEDGEMQEEKNFMDYYKVNSKGNMSPVREDKHYLRLVNTELILPMLSDLFSRGDVESTFILSPEVIRDLKITINTIRGTDQDKSINLDVYPIHLVVELTILLDYILCKVDFKKLNSNRLQVSTKELDDFLLSILVLCWKCIARKKDLSKLLVNLSKLVVSRLKNHSNVRMGDNEEKQKRAVKDLFDSVLTASEDIVDEETKQVWLNVCNILLPEIQQSVKDDQDKDFDWMKEFLKSMEESEPSSIQSRDIGSASNSNRWWITIFRNRHLMYDRRSEIFDSNKFFNFYSHLRTWLLTPKPNYFLYDTLLLYIAWYMLDYKKCKVEGFGNVADIFGLDKNSKGPHKEEFLVNVIREVVKKDEDYNSGFLNRSYFLFRAFTLFLGKRKLERKPYYNMLTSYQERGEAIYNAKDANQVLIKRRLKTNFVIMNICLVILYHPRIKFEEERDPGRSDIPTTNKELFKCIFDLVIKEMPQRLSKEYMKYPYLVSLAYHIIKRILVLADKDLREEYLENILNKSNESIRAILSGGRDNMRPESQDTLSLWIAVLLFKFIYDYKHEMLEGLLTNFVELAKLFCDNLKNKKQSKDAPGMEDHVHFDENEDVLEKFFVCYNVDTQDPKHISKGYYKGYSVLVMRILMRFVDKDSQMYFEQFNSDTTTLPVPKKHIKLEIPHVLLEVFCDLLGNPTPSEYDIKLEIIMLLRCLLIPQSITSGIYKKLTADKDFLTTSQKIGIINSLKIDQFLKKNEGRKAVNKIFVEYLWNLIIDFIE